jgi:glucose-6-phosphate isomerase
VKKINLLTKNSIQKKYLNKNLVKKLSKSSQKIFKEVENEINNPKKVLNILNKEFELNFKVKQIQKFKKYKTVVLIGMGGSILGAEAIYKFLEPKIKKKFYFFNNLEPKEIITFKKEENLNKILFIIISKSGNTIETISNLLSLKILKKKSKNIILISEKKNNLLFDISKKFNLFYVEHKNFIGGRFAVLSEVGLIPSYLMGLNIFKLRANIRKFLKGKNKSFLKDSSIKLSSLLNAKRINNLIFINYSQRFEKFLFWNQQLIAESLGKKGKGFLPVISSAPKDHHSLLQLYLDGPRDKLFYIFSVEEKIEEKIKIKKILNTNKYLHNKTLNNIKMAQKDALIKTFSKNKIPFREFKIKSSNEEVLGELFSYFILETIIVGKLIKTNPFDQPAVEQVKLYTKKLLS